MPRATRVLASAAVGGLLLLGASASSSAQSVSGPDAQSVGRTATFAPGSIAGVVVDDHGNPVAGAMVSGLGATTAFATTDRSGRFELKTLNPGPYLVRAHLTGYQVPRGQFVEVRPGLRAASSIAVRRTAIAPRVLAAGIGAVDDGPAPDADSAGTDPATVDQPKDEGDISETAWRIRHVRRGVLKDASIPADLLAQAPPAAGGFAPVDFLGRAAESSARLATNFFTTTPFSGQVNILASGSFDAPQDLFSSSALTRNIANISVSAPAGAQADWTVQGAFTQADIASWIVAGAYKSHAPATNSYDVGLSYATQRYSGGNPYALRDVSDGARNVGEVYGFDTLSAYPLSVTYGARYARYDYLDHRGLFSPRLEVAVTPGGQLRFNAMLSRRELAPGAEEFAPPEQSGVWLPPQRTFSSLNEDQSLDAERVTHMSFEGERDFGRSTVTFEVFRQNIDDQLVTLFGTHSPDQAKTMLGHYFVANGGDGTAAGYSAGVRTVLSDWVKGSVEFTSVNAILEPSGRSPYLMMVAPSALRTTPDNIRSLSTTIEASVPETSTHVLVVCRLSNGFARPGSPSQASSESPRFDSRFDVQVRQSLPFMDFSNARWEMLVAVRNFFREAAVDQSVYDELLSVRPPKRIVGGLTMRF